MKKSISIISILLFAYTYSYGQKTFKIYKDDSIGQYFKKLGKENGFFYDITNLKDTLPDGIYIFYNVNQKDSGLKDKRIYIKGKYKDSIKNGRFISKYNYTYFHKKSEALFPKYVHICNYKNGKKNGVEKIFNIINTGPTASTLMSFYGEYIMGEKNGLFIYFNNGSPIKVIIYKHNEISFLKEIPLILPKKFGE